jgi:hypothetical protein
MENRQGRSREDREEKGRREKGGVGTAKEEGERRSRDGKRGGRRREGKRGGRTHTRCSDVSIAEVERKQLQGIELVSQEAKLVGVDAQVVARQVEPQGLGLVAEGG